MKFGRIPVKYKNSLSGEAKTFLFMTQSQPDVQIRALDNPPTLTYPPPGDSATSSKPVSRRAYAFQLMLYIGHEGREEFHKENEIYPLLYGHRTHRTSPKEVIFDLVRKSFDPKGLSPYVLIEAGNRADAYLRVNQANIYMDSRDFKERADRLLQHPEADIRAEDIRPVLAIYRHHFLSDYRLDNKSPGFQSWVRRVRSDLLTRWQRLQILLMRYHIREKEIQAARDAALAWLEMALEPTWPLHYLIWLHLPDENERTARRYIKQLAEEEQRLKASGQICRQPLSSDWEMHLDTGSQPPLSMLDVSLYSGQLSNTAREVLTVLSRQTTLPVVILNAPPGGGKTSTLNELAHYARHSGVFDKVVSLQPAAGDSVVSIRWLMQQLDVTLSPAAALSAQQKRLKDELIRRRYLFLVDDSTPKRWLPLIKLLENTPGHLILTQSGSRPTQYLDMAIPALDKAAIKQVLMTYDMPTLNAAELDSVVHMTGGLPLLVHLFGSMAAQNDGDIHYPFTPSAFITHHRSVDGKVMQTADDRYAHFMAALRDYLFPKTRELLYALSLYDAAGATRDDLQDLLNYEDVQLDALLTQLAVLCEDDEPLRLHRVIIQQVRQWTDTDDKEARSLEWLEQRFVRQMLARLQPAARDFAYLDQHFAHIQKALTLLQTVTIPPERLLDYVNTLWELRHYLEHRHAYDLIGSAVDALLPALDEIDVTAIAATDEDMAHARMHLLQMGAQAAIRQSRYDDALPRLKKGLALCRDYGWQNSEAAILTDTGVVYQRKSEYEKALDYFQQAEDCLPEGADSDVQNRLHINRTLVYRAIDRADKAGAIYEAIITGGNGGDLDVHQTYTYLWALLCRGNQLMWDKSYESARMHYRELLQAARRYQNLLYEAYALLNLGVVAVWQPERELGQARFYFEEAMLATDQVRSAWLKTQTLYNRGTLDIIEGNIHDAISNLHQAQNIAHENDSAKLEARVRVGLGMLNYRIADRSMARNYWIGSIKQAPSDLDLVARALYGHALLALEEYTAVNPGSLTEETICEQIATHINAYNLPALVQVSLSAEKLGMAMDYFQRVLDESRPGIAISSSRREMIIHALQAALET
jgi:tetratricopeptide (TPR) repeat protein